jgi:hypothetical protein
VTNGGPRFDHQVCDWYRSIYATLREYDQDFFPFLDHQTLGDRTRSLLKSRRATSADVTAPSAGRPLAIHPSVAGAAWIALPYDMLTHDNIRAEASSEPGMTIRLAMNNYFKYDIGMSQCLLQYWEEDKQRMIKLFGPDWYIMLAINLREILRAHGMLPYRPPGWVDPLGEDQFNIMKEWNLKKHHQLMINNKRAAAQRRLEEAARKEAEVREFGATGAMLLHHANHPLVRSTGGGARLVQRERKGNAKTRKRGVRLKIEVLKTSGLLELTQEALQGRSVRDAVLEKLNTSGKVPTADCTPRDDEFEFEEVVSLDDYDAGPRSVLETDAMPEESQAKRLCSRSQVEREAQDLRNRLEQSRTFRRETGLMNFRTDRLGLPVRMGSSSRAGDSYRPSPDDSAEQRRRRDSRSPARNPGRSRKAHSPGRTSGARNRSRSRKRRPNSKPRQEASPRAERGRKRARSAERGGGDQARASTVSRGRAQEPMRIMHTQNIMDAPIPEEMASLTPLTAIAAGMTAEPPVTQAPPVESTPEAGDEATPLTTASFKIPKLPKTQPTAGTHPSEEIRREESLQRKGSPGGDEAMAVDLDFEVSDEDRKFVESSAPDSVDKMLDDFIGDKNSPVQSTLKPSLKKPEDTVKKPTGAALKKASKPSKTGSKSDEAEMRQMVKTLSSAQRAAFRKMLTSTLPSPKKAAKKSRK